MHYHIAVAPFIYKLWNNSHRMLQIAIHGNYRISLGVCQTGKQGILMAEVP
jgi:hypothetical protein